MGSYDFSGWATRNDLLCSDGRIIKRNAFSDNDGDKVPLVWNHQHNDNFNVLGHALLENRDEGVYAYCKFNGTEAGQNAKMLVEHGDVCALSIYANKLKQNGRNVLHGAIREVSLVLAGANPGAYIDSVIRHGEESEEEAIIYTGKKIYLSHSDEDYEDEEDYDEGEEEPMDDERTVQDVFDEMTDEQKEVVYAIVGAAVEDARDGDYEDDDEEYEDEEDYDYEEEGPMKHNVFDWDEEYDDDCYLSHAEEEEIFADARRCGSLKDAALAHGIDNIDILFPDAENLTDEPGFISREQDWVSSLMTGTKHYPKSRFKSMFADITKDDARARGYIKGNRKVEEVFSLLKRQTGPTTIYKKQKMERDDIIDINSFNAAAWVKKEMRVMLNEEIARAVLVGDGRAVMSEDKISEECIRPIWTDDELFTIQKPITISANASDDVKAKAFIKACVRSRKDYKGSGNPVMFMTEELLTSCLLLEDLNQRVIYDTVEKLATALRVSKIVTVPVMEELTRNVNGVDHHLAGIYLNTQDYMIGTDNGGELKDYEQFDIHYNAQYYLIETRMSGALVKPYSAVALEFVYSDGLALTVEPEDEDEMLLGKLVSALQDGIAVGTNSISGTLKHVTGYTGFSNDPLEQNGNFLALKITDTEDALTTVELVGGNLGRPIALDEDKNIVLRISNKSTQSIRVVTTKNGIVTTKNYGLGGLRCLNA